MTKKILLLSCALTLALAGYAAVLDSPSEAQQILQELQAADARQQPSALPEQPSGDSARFLIRQIRLEGNILLDEKALLNNLPAYFAPAGQPELALAPYDLRPIRDIAAGQAAELDAATIRAFTQYLLSVYQGRGYSGIYIYVPQEAFEAGGDIERGILPIRIIEALVGQIETTYYTPDRHVKEKGFLRQDVFERWAPVEPGKPISQRKLDAFLVHMNQNPDRYVSATVAPSSQPNALDVRFNIFEANPWHFFFQIDNAGTKDARYTPRVGLIHTNLLGYDDRLTVVYQAVPDKTFNEEFAVFGSYDFPLFTPRLRVTVYGGYNEFDISGADSIRFLGRGYFAGLSARYNLFQADRWLFDLTAQLTYDATKSTPSLFPEFLASRVHLTMGGLGAELSRKDDRSEYAAGFSWLTTLDGSPQSEFGLARTGARRDVNVYQVFGRASRFLDAGRVHRVTASARWIAADQRLAPSKMTSFGGMYTVRGYDEYEIIADGGILASAQYEFDIIRHLQIRGDQSAPAPQKPFLRKLAPAAFIDYGNARIQDALAGEHTDQELISIGGGLIVELTEHFTGTVYYGHPLVATEQTSAGKGRLHFGILVRW